MREALIEREVLLQGGAPHHLAAALRAAASARRCGPAWMVRLGLFLYDHLGGREQLPPTRGLDLRRDPAGAPLQDRATRKAFEYSDCWVDDARLVVLNALDAADRGASIRTRTRCIGARRDGERWRLDARGPRDRRALRRSRRAALVNAAGPWVADVLDSVVGVNAPAADAAGQGQPHRRAEAVRRTTRPTSSRTPTGRIVFAIPYERDFTLIGTTDEDL